VDEAGERQVVARAAALLVQAEGVGAGEAHRDAVVDQERQRGAEARHLELIFAGRREVAEVGLEHFLIRERAGLVADVRPGVRLPR
jgi:hypothetical protein